MKTDRKLSFLMPAESCNAHLHIIDPAFPNDGKADGQKGTVEEYRVLAEALGLARAVFVQAKPFALDNRCLLDAIRRFGSERSRGVAVVNAAVSDAELEELHSAGVRGLRFSVWNPQNAVVSFNDCLPLAARVAELGWHVQLHMSATQLMEHATALRALECRIVIDHMGRLDPRLGTRDPAYPFLCELIDHGRTWVKLSGPYLNTVSCYPWDDAAATAEAIAAFAPERVVWGTDFPHVTEKNKPDEFELTELLSRWLPTEKARCLALVSNPEELYGFEAKR